MTQFENIAKENKKLMMELQCLDLTTVAGQKRKAELVAILKNNNQDLQAYATALGTINDTPRILSLKTKTGLAKK